MSMWIARFKRKTLPFLKLYQKARELLVEEAHKQGIALRQSYKRVGKKAFIMQGRYSHARQKKRAAKQTRKLKTLLGRVIRDIRRKCQVQSESLLTLLERAEKIHNQKRNDKNKFRKLLMWFYCALIKAFKDTTKNLKSTNENRKYRWILQG